MENMEKMEIEKPSSNEGKETVFSQASRPQKYAASFVIYYCTFAFGMASSFLGPIIIDYSHKFNTEVSHVSFVFTIFLIGYLAGAFLNGVLNHCVSRQIFVLVLFTIVSIVFFIFPHVSSIEIFFVLACFAGLFGGGYDSAQTAWIIDIWRHEAAPFILTQCFAFSLGTIIPPLILFPFLHGGVANKDVGENSKNFSSPSVKNDNEGEKEQDSDLRIPFTIAGCILFLGLLMQLGLAFYYLMKSRNDNSDEKIKHSYEDAKAKDKVQIGGSGKTSNGKKGGILKYFPECRELILIILCCIFTSFYFGMEWGTMQFLPTFAHFSTVAFSESQGADLLFGFTMAFCIGRGIGIFVVLKTPPHFILCGNLVLITIANVILVIFADDSVELMWTGSVLYGLGLSTTFPSYFAFIEKYIFVSDSVAAVILACGAVVSAIYPLIVGNSVETNPAIMIYVNVFSLAILVCCTCVTFWLTLCKNISKKHGKIDNELKVNKIHN